MLHRITALLLVPIQYTDGIASSPGIPTPLTGEAGKITLQWIEYIRLWKAWGQSRLEAIEQLFCKIQQHQAPRSICVVFPSGPMPDLDSTVSLTWPDYASVCVHKDEQDEGNGEGKDWVIVYHSLDNRREKHMVLEPQFVEVCRTLKHLHWLRVKVPLLDTYIYIYRALEESTCRITSYLITIIMSLYSVYIYTPTLVSSLHLIS